MKRLQISADKLVSKLLSISKTEQICLLDSCGVNHLNSHLLIAGINPVETMEIESTKPDEALKILDEKLTASNLASVFTLSYDFGLKLQNIVRHKKKTSLLAEPDIFLALFDVLVIHDYNKGETKLLGNRDRFEQYEEILTAADSFPTEGVYGKSEAKSNFTKSEYLSNVEKIKELIRDGETYQTNLTQQFRVSLPHQLSPQLIFSKLRRNHPAPFAAFLVRKEDHVLSISPERFISTEDRKISASPIKGTRPRGKTPLEDARLKNNLLTSKKDRAENTMIVDLLRNDLGRVCEFGSVTVEKLCDLEEHPTLFHLVSTISGTLRKDTNYSEIIEAIFPCGSITGCPKIRTMEIIDEIETVDRGLSMGAIGYRGFDGRFDLNVAIRTMVIRRNEAVFNVGGGIIIDSDPLDEYNESLLKAEAILNALGVGVGEI